MIPTRQPHPQQQFVAGADLKAIEDYLYSNFNHTPEWKKAEAAYQNILSARLDATHTSAPAPAPDIIPMTRESLQAFKDETAKAERERFDKMLCDLAWKLCGNQKTNIYCETVDAEIQAVRKSLRQPEPAAHQQQQGVSEG